MDQNDAKEFLVDKRDYCQEIQKKATEYHYESWANPYAHPVVNVREECCIESEGCDAEEYKENVRYNDVSCHDKLRTEISLTIRL